MFKFNNYLFKLKNIKCDRSKNLLVTKLEESLFCGSPKHRSTVASIFNDRQTTPNIIDSETQLTKSYKEIPTLGIFYMIKNFLPGGKYYKLDLNQLLCAFEKDFGEIVKLPGFFGRPDIIFTYNVQDFEKVYRNEGVWPKRPGLVTLGYYRSEHRAEFFQGTNGLLAIHGEQWGKFRSLVNPMLMKKQNVRMYLNKMSQVNKEFIERVRQIRDPETLEVPGTFEEDLNRWTLESVSVVALDKQFGLLNKNHSDPKAKLMFKALTDFIALSLEVEIKPSIWKFYKTPVFQRLMQTCDTLLDITNSFINEAKERLEEETRKNAKEKAEHEKSILEKLLKIDPKIATIMAMDMFLVGVDSTTTTFTGILLSLAKNPKKQAKLRQEVMSILPSKDSEFTEESCKNMSYLKACIKESMRLYPLLAGNSRAIANDVVLSGYKVPKSTRVTMVSASMLRNEIHFSKPNEFLPERWLRTTSGFYPSLNTGSLKPNNPFIYLPFGFGPRSCIGRRIVEMELELGIARLVRNFYIDFNYSAENVFKAALVNVPNIPLKFKFSDVEY